MTKPQWQERLEWLIKEKMSGLTPALIKGETIEEYLISIEE